MNARLTGLFIYPVKSCAGVPVHSVTITDKGLAGDREWMIVNAEGRFVTQRQLPQMAGIQITPMQHGLVLSHQRAGDIHVPNPAPDAATTTVTVWKDACLASPGDSAVSDWLAQALNHRQPLRLVRFAKGFTRAPKPHRFGKATTHFADAAPFLITNEQSLAALNAHLARQSIAPVDMRRFRPNLIIDAPSFAEHRVARLTTDDCRTAWTLCDPCQRCVIITIDPDTGERDPKAIPFKQLAALNPMPDNPKAPAFGMNARLTNGAGTTLSRGMGVTLSASTAEKTT